MVPAIEIQDVAKRFRINHTTSGRIEYRTLRETLSEVVRSPLRNLRAGAALGKVEDFWALRDINASIRQGETVGLIGRNGAGKSTLLKILTRITHPTQGRVKIAGRVGSLLEVGTGFHPELTGRENVFLNGSILGMSRKETRANFDRIVDFAGVERFIDTPIKRYSSGMKVRLAFAVAAHLDLEVLLIDEVLAVGDAEFQRKCLGKMNDIGLSGRTVLFVSHNMAAVQSLCSRAILLENGTIVADGESPAVVAQYLKGFEAEASSRDVRQVSKGRHGSGEVKLQRVEIRSSTGEPVSSIVMGDDLVVHLELKASKKVTQTFASITICDDQEQTLCQMDGQQAQNWSVDLDAGQPLTLRCLIPQLGVAPGRYSVNVWVHRVMGRMLFDFLPHVVYFEVLPGDVFGTGQLPRGKYIFIQSSDWSVVSAAPRPQHTGP